jgi:hypothetical protein
MAAAFGIIARLSLVLSCGWIRWVDRCQALLGYKIRHFECIVEERIKDKGMDGQAGRNGRRVLKVPLD